MVVVVVVVVVVVISIIVQVANNLHWHAGLDNETIGKCLDMSLDEAPDSKYDAIGH